MAKKGKEPLFVKSKVREFIKSKGCNTSSAVLDGDSFNDIINKINQDLKEILTTEDPNAIFTEASINHDPHYDPHHDLHLHHDPHHDLPQTQINHIKNEIKKEIENEMKILSHKKKKN